MSTHHAKVNYNLNKCAIQSLNANAYIELMPIILWFTSVGWTRFLLVDGQLRYCVAWEDGWLLLRCGRYMTLLVSSQHWRKALTTRGYHEALQEDLLHIPGPTVRTDKGYPDEFTYRRLHAEIGRGCYVDGTFSIIRSGRKAAFKAHLSSIFTDIQITAEEEKDRALPFLDVLVGWRDVR